MREIGQLGFDAWERLVEKVGVPKQCLRRERLDGVVPGEELVQHDAHGPEVGALVGAAGLKLFRGHVRHRSRERLLALVLGAKRRDAEVEHLYRPARRHEDVLWLEIPVHDPVLVGAHERADDRDDELDGPIGRLLSRPGGLAQV